MDQTHSAIRIIETIWIPLSDGRRLAARLFLPPEDDPVPCLLEYLPYRRRDGTRRRDDVKYGWFAAHGYAGLRVDIAGTGDSDGIIEDEYLTREQEDAVEVIEWIARQSWCNGRVGMMGISWGGINALQVAARRPPALGAIITICSTDDRYGCDAHYMGGGLLNDNFGWGGSFFHLAALPPDPSVVGEEHWHRMWQDRVAQLRLFPAEWLRHQLRDAFWRQGSVNEDHAAIECPVLAVGGWLDGYVAPVYSLMEGLTAPRKAIIGPWGHIEPHQGVPSPKIDFLGECLRWWDRWLKGICNDVEDLPDYRVYLMDPAVPASHFSHRPGRWLAQNGAETGIARRTLFLGAGGLQTTSPAPETAPPMQIHSPQITGMRAQEWCPYGHGRVAAESAPDQREDDACSLCFNTSPLEADMAILGAARLTLRLQSDQPQAMLAARLCDVAPDGTSTLLAFGLLNLSHREGHCNPRLMAPTAWEEVSLALKPVGQIVPAGHRLRLAVSSGYWPMMWPSPLPATLTLDPTGSRLNLPVLTDPAALTWPDFGAADAASAGPVTIHGAAVERRCIKTCCETESTTFEILSDDGDYELDEIGTRITSRREKTYHITRDDPLSCRTRVACATSYRRGDWNARQESWVECYSDATHFHLTAELKAWSDGQLLAERHFNELIPRNFL